MHPASGPSLAIKPQPPQPFTDERLEHGPIRIPGDSSEPVPECVVMPHDGILDDLGLGLARRLFVFDDLEQPAHLGTEANAVNGSRADPAQCYLSHSRSVHDGSPVEAIIAPNLRVSSRVKGEGVTHSHRHNALSVHPLSAVIGAPGLIHGTIQSRGYTGDAQNRVRPLTPLLPVIEVRSPSILDSFSEIDFETVHARAGYTPPKGPHIGIMLHGYDPSTHATVHPDSRKAIQTHFYGTAFSPDSEIVSYLRLQKYPLRPVSYARIETVGRVKEHR